VCVTAIHANAGTCRQRLCRYIAGIDSVALSQAETILQARTLSQAETLFLSQAETKSVSACDRVSTCKREREIEREREREEREMQAQTVHAEIDSVDMFLCMYIRTYV